MQTAALVGDRWALLIVIVLLYLQFRSIAEAMIVLLSITFALVGSVWLLWLLDYRVSTAVRVGIIVAARNLE